MNGDAPQIDELYQTAGSGLLRYIRRLGGGGCSEDLLQETFVRAIKQPERISGARSPQAWLYGVARHIVLDYVRKHSRMAELTIDPPAPATPLEDPRMTRVKAAMAQLPHDQHEVLRLRLDAEFSYEEIASVLNIPVGTVRSRLHHAIRKLRTTVGEKETS